MDDAYLNALACVAGRSDDIALASTLSASLPQFLRAKVATPATCSSERRQANEGIANCASVGAVRGVVALFRTTEITESGFAAGTTGLPVGD